MGRLRISSLGPLLVVGVLLTAGVSLIDWLVVEPRVAIHQEAALREQAAKVESQVKWALQMEADRLAAHCRLPSAVAGETPDASWDAFSRCLGQVPYVHAAWICDPAGRAVRVWSRPDDAISARGLTDALGDSPHQSLGVSPAPAGPADFGMLKADGRVLLYACRPADGSAPSGTGAADQKLYVAQLFTGGLLARLGVAVPAKVTLVDADHMPQGAAASTLSQCRPWPLERGLLAVGWPVHSRAGQALGYFRADFSVAGIQTRGAATHRGIVRILRWSAGALMLVFLGVGLVLDHPIRLLRDRLRKLVAGKTSLESLSDGLGAEARTLAEELQSAFQAMSLLSNTDAMTGLVNRRGFDDALDREYRQSRRYDRALSVLMLDIDLFKAINDTKGHAVGDEVIKIVAGLVKQGSREVDSPARLGGDEFAVLLPETASFDAGVVAERIRKSVAERTYTIEGSEIGFTVSIGVADIHSGRTDKPEDLLGLADEALYAAKQLGRNRSVQAHETREEAWGDAHVDEQQRVDMLRAKLMGLDTQFKSLFVRALQEIVHVMERRDPLMADHARKVQRYSAAIGKQLNLSEDLIKQIEMAALLHDIGMLALPDAVALCPGRLNEQQLETMQRHPMIGARILDGTEFLEQVIPVVRFHHERFDGKGYPEGLSGLGIPPICRVVAVADAFDAMTSRRTFREGMTTEQAIGELRKGSGAQFDPEMVEAFVAAAERLGDRLTNLSLAQAGTDADKAPDATGAQAAAHAQPPADPVHAA